MLTLWAVPWVFNTLRAFVPLRVNDLMLYFYKMRYPYVQKSDFGYFNFYQWHQHGN